MRKRKYKYIFDQYVLTHQYLTECFEYNPQDGHLYWKERPREHFIEKRSFTRFVNNSVGKQASYLNKGNGEYTVKISYKIQEGISKIIVIAEHRLIWYLLKNEIPEVIDHIDRNRLNNKIENLRNVSRYDALKCYRQKALEEYGVHLGKETLFDDCQNWFQVCKPSPTESDISTQTGAVLEEMAEFVESLGLSASQLKDYSAQFYQNSLPIPETVEDKVNQLDAISDILVTLTGYSYMKGFDLKGAFEEVNLSNASKLENGKPVLREDGKIMKGKDYKAPELKPFIGK